MDKKSKAKRIVVLICAAAIVFAVVLAFGKYTGKKRTISPDEIADFKVEYMSYGGMEGVDIDITLEPSPDGNAVLTYRETSYVGGENKDESYTVPYEALERVKALYAERGVPFWGELPLSEFIALDAPTRAVIFWADGERTELSSDLELPKEGAGIINEVRSILNEYRK
ncbi:MAG: hypothetical protein IKD89_00965 [Clostridia bacterium]|nr:hypothetical protein [Clostridia bacterium]